MKSKGNPILELKDNYRHVKIYANGVVEGWPESTVTSFLGLAVRPEVFDFFSKPGAWDFNPPHYGTFKEGVDTNG